MLVCAFLCANCTRDRGCSAPSAFPAPSLRGRMLMQTSGRSCRENENVCLSAPRIFPPALRPQRAGRALAAAIPPIVLRAAFAEITGVGMLTDQIDQPCPAE